MSTPFVRPSPPIPVVRPEIATTHRRASFTVLDLVLSAQPAVVFTSLAALSVPTFSDKCSIVIEEDDELTYRIGRSVSDDVAPANEHSLRTPIFSGPSAEHGEFHGVVIHSWFTGHRPTYADAALIQLMVDSAVSVIHQERATGGSPAGFVTSPADPSTPRLRATRPTQPRPTQPRPTQPRPTQPRPSPSRPALSLLGGHHPFRTADGRREQRLRYPACPQNTGPTEIERGSDAGPVGGL